MNNPPKKTPHQQNTATNRKGPYRRKTIPQLVLTPTAGAIPLNALQRRN
jgi:hypothetical protein